MLIPILHHEPTRKTKDRALVDCFHCGQRNVDPTAGECPMRLRDAIQQVEHVRDAQERILCAAIYVDTGVADPPRMSHSYPKTGLMITGWRHSDCFTTLFALAEKMTEDEREACNRRDDDRVHPDRALAAELTDGQVAVIRAGLRGYDKGFMTSKGRYVDRDEAGHIAFVAGQVDRDGLNLTSEHVY